MRGLSYLKLHHVDQIHQKPALPGFEEIQEYYCWLVGLVDCLPAEKRLEGCLVEKRLEGCLVEKTL